MNRTININLGGFPLTVDESAYELLSQYIINVEDYFSNSEGCDDITSDIEYRLAELIKKNMGPRSIATVVDVQTAINILGTPDLFSDEDIQEKNIQTEDPFDETVFEKTGNESKKYTPGKKLYRNTDEQVVAGVCSGLAAYFGIQDPVWVRLAFALITISGGAGVIAYLVLWAIVPAAKNSADRLAMKGEKINISNIAKEVESQINNISAKISGLGKKMAPENNTKSSYSNFGGDGSDFVKNFEKKIENSANDMVNKAGAFIREIVIKLGKTLKNVVKWVAVFFLIILGIIWVASTIVIIFNGGALSMLLPFGIIGSIFFALITLFMIITPFVITGFRLTGAIEKSPYKKQILSTSGLLWGMSILIFCFCSVNWVKEFNSNSKVTHKETLVYHENYVIKGSPSEKGEIQFGNISVDNTNVYSNYVGINFHTTPDSIGMIEYTKKTRGKNKADDIEHINNIQYDFSMEGNVMTFPTHLKLKDQKEWRGQNIIVDVYIPYGTEITVDKKLLHRLNKIEFADKGTRLSDFTEKTNNLKATEKGFEKVIK